MQGELARIILCSLTSLTFFVLLEVFWEGRGYSWCVTTEHACRNYVRALTFWAVTCFGSSLVWESVRHSLRQTQEEVGAARGLKWCLNAKPVVGSFSVMSDNMGFISGAQYEMWQIGISSLLSPGSSSSSSSKKKCELIISSLWCLLLNDVCAQSLRLAVCTFIC